METITLPNGYNPKQRLTFRPMTLDETKALRTGQRVWVASNLGDARQVTVNGQPKTWKRQPDRVEVPWKYGLYDYGRFSFAEQRFLVRVGDE